MKDCKVELVTKTRRRTEQKENEITEEYEIESYTEFTTNAENYGEPIIKQQKNFFLNPPPVIFKTKECEIREICQREKKNVRIKTRKQRRQHKNKMRSLGIKRK